MEKINKKINELKKDYEDLLDTGENKILKFIKSEIRHFEEIQEYVVSELLEEQIKSSDMAKDFLNGKIEKETFASYHDLEQCAKCKEWNYSNDLTDTEGMLEGGIGNLCPDCLCS